MKTLAERCHDLASVTDLVSQANVQELLKTMVCVLQMQEQLLEANIAKFEFYEESHRKKGTPEADEKANVNRRMANLNHRALTILRGASADEPVSR